MHNQRGPRWMKAWVMTQAATRINTLWYSHHPAQWLLWPLSWIYQVTSTLRRVGLQRFMAQKAPVPIIVVGNLSVGGTGKTPLVMSLVQQLQQKGLRVGIVSRGYGATIRTFPHEVGVEDKASAVGDEPLMLARRTGVPVVIAKRRMDAVNYLLAKHSCQVIVSDDGLQHYRMGRAIEIVVLDGARGFGNGQCLPAGPLREKPSRLRRADFVVVNGEPARWHDMPRTVYTMKVMPGMISPLLPGPPIEGSALPAPIAALAGIGDPKKFFTTLDGLGIVYQAHPFPDHYAYTADEVCDLGASILMTEKDAVKCLAFATKSMYFLPVNATMDPVFWHHLWAALQGHMTHA